MKGYIYSIVFQNGKMYIGQTIKRPDKRVNQHISCAFSSKEKDRRACPKLYAAIRKYGQGSFVMKVIEEHEAEVNELYSTLDSREIKLISEFDTVKNGYNCVAGGCGFRGLEKSPEVRAKIRDRMIGNRYGLGHRITEEHRKILSAVHSGKIIDENTRRKMGLNKSGSKHPQFDHAIYTFQHPVHGTVSCTKYELYKKYSLNRGGVSALVSGKMKSSKNWVIIKPAITIGA